MSRGGRKEPFEGPRRTCVGCRQSRPAGELLRVALSEGRVVVDPSRRLPGRGAWMCPSQACVPRAARALPRALRSPGLKVAEAALEEALAATGRER